MRAQFRHGAAQSICRAVRRSGQKQTSTGTSDSASTIVIAMKNSGQVLKYLMPTASDFPNIRGKFLNLAPAPGNPLGAKGGGEGGMVAVAAAIGNAVTAALSSFGVQARDLPLSPPRVWRLIRDAEAAAKAG